MSMGLLLSERMKSIGIDLNTLADETLIDYEELRNIIDNNVDSSIIDEFDLGLISSVLLCTPDYFIDEEIRKKDMVNASLNRGEVDTCTNRLKAKLQLCTNDLIFLQSIRAESRR